MRDMKLWEIREKVMESPMDYGYEDITKTKLRKRIAQEKLLGKRDRQRNYKIVTENY